MHQHSPFDAAIVTLGLLIPPSIIMIVYGVMAEVSITKLFIAGIVPGWCSPVFSWVTPSFGRSATRAVFLRLIAR